MFTREDTSNLQQIKAKLPGEPCPQSFDVCALSEQEVYEELCKLDVKKAGGPDGLPGRLLKEAASFIAKPYSLSLWQQDLFRVTGKQQTFLQFTRRAIVTNLGIIDLLALPH